MLCKYSSRKTVPNAVGKNVNHVVPIIRAGHAKRNLASVTGKTTKYVKVSVSKRSGHSE